MHSVCQALADISADPIIGTPLLHLLWLIIINFCEIRIAQKSGPAKQQHIQGTKQQHE